MGLMDWLFGQELEETPPPRILETTGEKNAKNWLTELLKEDVDVPRRKVAGLSKQQRQGLTVLDSILAGEAFEDPRDSMYYRGIRDEMDRAEEKGVEALRRRAAMGGNFHSSTAVGAEGEFRADMAGDRLQILGSLYDRERERDNPYTRLAAAMGFGDLPRQIDQERYDAEYLEESAETRAPYELQAPIAQTLQRDPGWYQGSYYIKPSLFQNIASLFGLGRDVAMTAFPGRFGLKQSQPDRGGGFNIGFGETDFGFKW